MSSVSTSGSGAPKSSFSFGRIWDQYGMLVVFAVLFIACAIFVPNFATFINMKGLGLAISMSGMVACGMSLWPGQWLCYRQTENKCSDHNTGNDADCSRSGVHHFRR